MDKEKIWQTVLENLKISLSPANFNTWFPQTFIVNIKPVEKNRQIIEIGCPNPFVRQTVEDRYYGLIKEALDQATEKKNDLVFVVKQNPQQATGNRQQKKEPLFEKPEENPQVVEAINQAGLRPDFNFENFAVSSTNQMAYAAAQAVVKSPGKAYNPLFLYGGVGVGKTHLIQAIGNAILVKNPKTKLVYCTGEEFTNEIVEAIRKKTTEEFKKKYRTVKILLVDDIQFIAGREKVQEEFFHTFNALWRVGGQIVLTSDRPPSEIRKLEDRLRSRFEGGLIVDIQPPDFELRTAILLIKAQQRGINLSIQLAKLIAGNITSTRGLEGFLAKIINEIQVKKVSLSEELVTALLGKLGTNDFPSRFIKPKEVISAVASYFNLKVSDLLGERRLKEFVLPRQILMYFLRTDLKLSLVEVGRLLGGRDHSTIIYGVEKITKLLPSSEDLRVDMAGIRKRLYG
ncbi:MAG: chromosomal replication initiator protein DnaA [Microgenomates group bacterium]